MLRVLDPARAVELRGWSIRLDDEFVLGLANLNGAGFSRHTLSISAGSAPPSLPVARSVAVRPTSR
ncbi:hypothetical protein ACFYVC_38590 [Streptomyces tendae]|uniref:hypothetical protein n=1 Tax=Streptomyces tendae TaxID=1932 RepID=UPI0036AD5B43